MTEQLSTAHIYYIRASQVALVVKNPLANVGGEGNGNPLQYSCLENAVDRGAWWAAVHRVAQSWTRLKRISSSSISVSLIRDSLSIALQDPQKEGKGVYAKLHRNKNQPFPTSQNYRDNTDFPVNTS